MLWKLVVVVVAWRVFNSLSLATFFQADEFYQALEIAHERVFGYGYVTWEWPQHLRLTLHPLLYSLGYSFLEAFNADSRAAVKLVPKFINAAIAAISELMMYKWLGNYDPAVATITTLLSLANPFNWYVSTRLFSNQFEQMLTMCAMAWWPWSTTTKSKKRRSSSHLKTALVFAVLSCIVRPTNVLYWIPFGLGLLARSHVKVKLIVVTLMVAVVTLIASAMVDRHFYTEWTLPMINFLKFNVVNNLLVFYGTAPWHFYIGQALPMMLMTYIPLFLLGLVKSARTSAEMVAAMVLVVLGFLAIEHKEVRFLLPIQPLLMYFCGTGVLSVMRSKWFKPVMAVVIAVNVSVGYFLGRVNERGAIAIVDYLANVPLFAILAPCHLTPWQSHLHQPDLNGWFLTCEPPLNVPLEGYMDESDVFYANPQKWLDTNMASNWSSTNGNNGKRPWPTHLVMFDCLVPELELYLADSPYRECHREWNSYFHWDGRRHGDLVVFCRQ